ncbi:MAG: hypothetical protein FWD76_00910 [Firmicutes bacterium]|nr:hypothetical protein [Bacillota bacterium]
MIVNNVDMQKIDVANQFRFINKKIKSSIDVESVTQNSDLIFLAADTPT